MRQPSLQNRRTGHYGNAILVRGLQETDHRGAVALIALRQRLHHGEVIRQLHDFEVMLLASYTFSDLDHIAKKQHVSRGRSLTVAVPGRCAVAANFSSCNFPFENGESILELFVKVKPKWRENEMQLKEYGY